MTAPPPVTFSRDDADVGWLVLDDPSARVTLLDDTTQAALDAAITRAAAETGLRALVIIGRKERIFVAGADLERLATLANAATAADFSRSGQRLLQRLADFPVPVVCAIHGACAGGGFELALACHWRVATDADVTRIGLPETSLGTIPGWGGSVRLPRLIGVKPALEHILDARLLCAPDALRAGLVHEVVAPGELRSRAKAAASRLAVEGRPPPSIAPAAVPSVFEELRTQVRARTRGHEPALLAAIDVVEQTSQLPVAAALEIEARMFGEVTVTPECRNLIHVFRLRESARKRSLAGWFPEHELSAAVARARAAEPIRRVGIIGAGVMGSGIAHWLAARGLEVVLRDVMPECMETAEAAIRRLLDQDVKRGILTAGAANTAIHRIATTTGWDGFDRCDLVIEAIIEDVTAKRRLLHELDSVATRALLASNTSALPLEEMARGTRDPSRLVGIHFFNPVSRMRLIELVLSRDTSPFAAARVLDFVKAIEKTAVICRSSPGFLMTRVLFFYLNEAVRLWEQGVTLSAIDEALREFGWPMGPLRLIDEVGVDVANFIFSELEHYFPDRFTSSRALGRMVSEGLLGRKQGAGFHVYDGKEAANEPALRDLVGRVGDLALSSGEISARLMAVMAAEAERCLAEGVIRSADDVDFALLSGAGFPAFRGGLLRWARGSRV